MAIVDSLDTRARKKNMPDPRARKKNMPDNLAQKCTTFITLASFPAGILALIIAGSVLMNQAAHSRVRRYEGLCLIDKSTFLDQVNFKPTLIEGIPPSFLLIGLYYCNTSNTILLSFSPLESGMNVSASVAGESGWNNVGWRGTMYSGGTICTYLGDFYQSRRRDDVDCQDEDREAFCYPLENTKGVAVGDVPGTKVEVPCTVFNKDDINAFSISTDEDAVFDEEQSVLYGWDLDNTYFDNKRHETGQFLLIFGYVSLGCFSLVGCCVGCCFALVKDANATSNDEEEKSNDEEDDPSVAAPAEQQLHSSVQSDEQRPNQSKKEAQYDSRSARDVAIELQTRELEQD